MFNLQPNALDRALQAAMHGRRQSTNQLANFALAQGHGGR
jgi:hypothetical protein